jgi:hypothetical protein
VAESGFAGRPFCSEVSRAAGEPLGATASRVESWLLVELGGQWPFDPLDATALAGAVREHLSAQLRRLPRSRLLLVRRPGRARRERARVVFGSTPERGRWFHGLRVNRYADLLELDLAAALLGESPAPGEPIQEPLLLVCTHGKRDRCCARYGVELCEALHSTARRGWVWQSSHVGGDRFAGNLVVLPEGLYFGRVAPADAVRVAESYAAGRIDLDTYRGRSCYPFPEQAAELRVRRDTGLVGFDDLRLVGRRQTGPGAWTIELLAEPAAELHEVDVGVELGDETYLTCRAGEQRRPRRYVARSHRVRPQA